MPPTAESPAESPPPAAAAPAAPFWGLSAKAGSAAGAPPTAREQAICARLEAFAAGAAGDPAAVATLAAWQQQLAQDGFHAAAATAAAAWAALVPDAAEPQHLALRHLYRAGYVGRVAALVGAYRRRFGTLPPGPAAPDAAAARRLQRRLAGSDRPYVARPAAPAAARPPLRVAYVANSTLPYAVGGYATRTHSLAVGMARQGLAPSVFARSGFPSRALYGEAATAVPAALTLAAVPYHFDAAHGPAGRHFAYLEAAAARLAERAPGDHFDVVHAASNATVGLPALLHAMAAGLPFVYEVRSLWETTQASRDPGFPATPLYRRQATLERVVGLLADHVLALTPGLAAEVRGWGVEPARVTLAPNAVDAAAFCPLPPDAGLARSLGLAPGDLVVGYVGSLVFYEGLELLVEAVAALAGSHPGLKLLIVGADTPGSLAVAAPLRRLAAARGIGDRLLMPGRVAFAAVPAYYALIDIAAFPRRSLPVTELVAPLKPLEAMAMARCVVVAEVGGMRDLVQPGVTGLVHRPDDVASLVAALATAAADAEQRARLGRAARAFVVAERSWQRVVADIGAVYAGLGRRPPADWPARAAAAAALLAGLP